MSYKNKLLKRFDQLANRMCHFYSDGSIRLTRSSDKTIKTEECTIEELEFALGVLEDIHFDGKQLEFSKESYDDTSSDVMVVTYYDYVIDLERKTNGMVLVKEEHIRKSLW